MIHVTRKAGRLILPVLSAFIIAGVILRIVNAIMEPSLWADEIFSVALAESPLLDAVLAVLRFDTHPPLYYIQLNAWASFDDSDRWFILNSTLESIAAIAVLYLACSRIFGRGPAIWAAAIFAVMPLQLFFAENVRMYPMFMILVIGLWYVLQRMEQEGRVSARHAWAALAFGLAVTFTHGLGFFVAFFVFANTISWLWPHVPRRDLIKLLAVYLVVALAALYPLGIALIRQTEGVATLDLPTLGIHLTLTLLGLEFPWPTVAGFVALPLMLLLPITQPRSRRTAGLLAVLPMCLLLVISFLVKPIFIYRTLGLFLPFVAIALGLYADAIFRSPSPFQRAAVASLLVVMLAAGINYTATFEKQGFHNIVGLWEARASADSVMLTNSPSEFWGIIRYLENGEGKASALAVQPPVRDHMLRVKEKLESAGAGALNLFGSRDHAAVGQRKVYPYLPDTIIASQENLWILNPSDPDCGMLSADGESFKRTDEFRSDGHHMIHCRRSPPQPGAGRQLLVNNPVSPP